MNLVDHCTVFMACPRLRRKCLPRKPLAHRVADVGAHRDIATARGEKREREERRQTSLTASCAACLTGTDADEETAGKTEVCAKLFDNSGLTDLTDLLLPSECGDQEAARRMKFEGNHCNKSDSIDLLELLPPNGSSN